MAEPGWQDETVLRSLRRKDVGALLALWNESAEYDRLNSDLLGEKVWQDPDFEPGGALVCERGEHLCGFVMAVVRASRDDHSPAGFIKLLAVGRRWQCRGVGSQLLRAAEQYLADRHAATARVGESAPNYLVPGVDQRYGQALRFFGHHGYQPIGEACNMTADLAGKTFDSSVDETRLAAQGITIRRAVHSDRAPLSNLLEEFGGTWNAEVFQSLAHAPALVHVACRGDQWLGFAASEGNNLGTGWFGPMGTTRSARGLGIGKVLLLRCLADLQGLGFEQAIIPWVAPVEFYARLADAKVSRRFQRFEKELK